MIPLPFPADPRTMTVERRFMQYGSAPL